MERPVFLRNLEKYLNSGCLSRGDVLLSLISSRLPFIKNSRTIIEQHSGPQSPLPGRKTTSFSISVEPYRGKNPYVLKMMDYLEKHLSDDLVAAFVHGSLATAEETAYSDFDALVILKDEVFAQRKRLARAAYGLSKAQSIMFDFDPLQHHGWFVLTGSDLDNYPECYFPVELFEKAKSLFPRNGWRLKVYIQNSHDKNRELFSSLSAGIINQVDSRHYPKNMYQLKFFMSRFMLLPVSYVQARDQRGVFKKLSFVEARRDFSAEVWSVMDEVSRLRENWSYALSPLKRKIASRPSQPSRYFARRYGPAISPLLRNILTEDFYQRMRSLVSEMQRNIR